MGEDVYSMLFCNCLNSDYIYYYDNQEEILAQVKEDEDAMKSMRVSSVKTTNGTFASIDANLVISMLNKTGNAHLRKMINNMINFKKSRIELVS